MTSKTVEVTNKIGFHARPASLLIDSAKNFSSAITLEAGGKSTNLKSIVALLKMQVKMGDTVVISAEGADEGQAVNALAALITSGFGEE